MTQNEFLKMLGWPEDRLGELGAATWSAAAADGFSKITVGIAREIARIGAWVSHDSLEGSKSMMVLESVVEGGSVRVVVSHVGDPPEAVDEQETIDLFTHMRSGMGTMRFQSAGPLELR